METSGEPRGAYTPAGTYGNLIAGEHATGGASFTATEASTGSPWAEFAESGPAEVDRAVAAARAAFGSWRLTSTARRQEILWAIADRLAAAPVWPALLATENGRPIREAIAGDAPAASAIFRFYAGVVRDHGGRTLDSGSPGVRLSTVPEPLGVIAALLPWNAPLIELALKVAPALAAGNTVVVKPSELASASSVEFALRTADLLPPGVLNVVTGGPAAGAALVAHPGVAKVTFTGGTATAAHILTAAAAGVRPSVMELGGKSAFVIGPDADPEAALYDAANGIFHHNGQVCFAASRLYVHDALYDDFTARLADLADRIRIGDALDPATQLGPLVSAGHRDRVLGTVDRAVAEGARILCGGTAAPAEGELEGGFYVRPTVLEDAAGTTCATSEEIFGPVLTVRRWRTEEEVLAWANASPYGLAAGVWTRDLAAAHRFAAGLEAGTVWINTWLKVLPGQPLGGIKQSGFGREMCAETLAEFSSVKSIHVSLDDTRPALWG